MKTKIVLSSVVIFSFAAILAVSVPAIGLLSLFGGVTALAVVGFACLDYARKPSFRALSAKKSTAGAEASAKSTPVDALANWTYQTLSA